MANIAMIIAGGTGARMQQDIPKQFLTVHEKPVIVYTLEAFERHPDIDSIAVVCLEGWETVLRAYAKQFDITKLDLIVPGGPTGQASIRNGAFALEQRFAPDDLVLIHDAIRPMVSEEIISDCISVARRYGSAVTVIPCAEAMLGTEDGEISTGVTPRENLKRTQTPQAFPLGTLCRVHREALARGIENSVATCTLFIEMGRQVHFSKGSEKNIKLTTLEDIDIFKALLLAKRSEWLKDR
ncbi:MAG: 2-C-methyl-D-erythritol 4-phosphate cytidylyltransferase [Clostridiales bacterium]|nr:2-C-methyl-D-erythritol 4-phosphate cytidylyltransferase [Clostridiales bacterium]